MPYMYTEDDPTVLVHYGRQGMKWYQHLFGDDPRWGKAGRAKGAKKAHDDAKQRVLDEHEQAKGDSPMTPRQHLSNVKRKNISKISDDTLKEGISRLENQKKYKGLVDSELRPGKSMIRESLKKVSQATLEGLGYGAASAMAGKLAKYLERKQPNDGYNDAAEILKMCRDYLKGKTVPKKK